MDTNRMRYFCLIAETGSLTKAADLLGLSHSALSKSIRVLEGELNTRLFLPQGRGLKITDSGRVAYSKCQEILRSIDALKFGHQATESVRIGFSEVISGALGAELQSELPGQIRLVEASAGEIEAKIVGDEIDFGFTFVPFPQGGVEHLRIGKIRMNVWSINGDDDLAFAVPGTHTNSNPLSFRNRDGFPHTVERDSTCIASNFSIAVSLVRAGQAMGYMPDFVARFENRWLKTKLAKVKSYAEAVTDREIYLVKSEGMEESTEMKKSCRILRKLIR